MPDPGVGFEYPPRRVSWLKRDALLFNLSIGCQADELHYLYELHPDFSTFPTFPLSLVFKLDTQEVIDFYATQQAVKIPGVPDLDPTRLVDGDRTLQIVKPLPVTSQGRDFEFRSRVLGVYDKGAAGTVVKSEDALVDAASGEVYARNIGSLFYVGQGNWGGPRGPPTERHLPPEGKAADLSFEVLIERTSAHLYRLNGDYNPLHATPENGQKMGYGGLILHGVFAYNKIAHEIVRLLGDSQPQSLKEISARFASAVRPGDKIKVDVWKVGDQGEGWEDFRWLATVGSSGKMCLQDGRAVVRGNAKQSPSKL